jgi:FkbM family methyltransferase
MILQKIITKIKIAFKENYIRLFRIKGLNYNYLNVIIKLNFEKDVDRRIYLHGFENETINHFLKCLKKGDIVVDIGANIGIYSLLASKKIGEDGEVFAFEPAPIASAAFKNNIERNNLKNIKLFNKGVAEFTGEAILNICADDAYNTLGSAPMKEITSQHKIELVSLDDFFEYRKVNRINVIKIDTEGAEFLIFQGAKKTLEKFKPILFFEYNPHVTEGFNNTTEDALILLKSIGYIFFEFQKGHLIEIVDIKKIRSNDIIAYPNETNTF